MAYQARWEAEIAEMRRVLGGFAMKEECKWGKPTYTVDGKNIVIMQGFKELLALGFFQGALLKDSKKVLVQLGQEANVPRHLRSRRVLCRNSASLSADVVKHYVERAARRARLTDSGVHRLRHTFCSHLAMRGAPARAISRSWPATRI